MISLNSLAAFTAEVTRNAGIQPVRGPGGAIPATPATPPGRDMQDIAAPQKALPAVPATPPAQALPRGSLLDLRV